MIGFRNLWLSIFLFILGSSALFGQRGLPFIYNYGSDDYSAGIQNWDISQDDQGRIFIANNFGLLIFDGQNWSLVNTADGTKLRSVMAMDERVYAGYQKNFGYYQPNELGQLEFISLADSLPSQYRDFDEIWKIYTVDESIYFCGFDYIFKYANGKIETADPNANLEITFLNQRELYVQVWEKGLTVLKDDQFELVPNGEFFADKRISGIIPLDKNSLLISCFNEGLFTYSNGQLSTFKTQLELPYQSLIVNATVRLKNGDIALGTQNNGLIIIDKEGNVKSNLNKLRGLIDNTVNSMFEDSQGNLWLSMNNGISRIAVTSPFSILDYRLGINGAGYAALSREEGIYLGTNNGLYLLRNGQSELIPGSEGQVYSIQELDGNLLVGHHNGPMLIRNGRVELLNDEKGAWLFRSIPNRPNEYLIGTYLGLRKLIQSGNRWTVSPIRGFDESSRVMHFEGDHLWVTQGYKGAFKLTFNEDYSSVETMELYNSNKGFPTDILINVFDIGNQLIFGSETGVYEYKQATDRFERVSTLNAAMGEEVALVDLDNDELGNIYYIASDAIGKLMPESGTGYENQTNTFNTILNLWNDDLGNIQVLNAEHVLIGAREGFIHYSPALDLPLNESFTIQFKEIQLNNKKDSLLYAGFGDMLQNGVSLPFRFNNITFQYAATHFASENQVEYAYRLQNFGEEWSQWTNDAKQTFTNLYEGEYKFEVKARNVYGQESTPIAFEFEVRPPIYRTRAAYAFYTLGTLSLLFLGFKTLDYRHKQEKAELEDSKNKLITQKEEEIRTVSEKSEAEIVQLKNDKLQTELKLKNQALTSSAMNLIQKNQLLNQIKNTLKSLSDDDQEKGAKQKLQRIVKSIDRDLSASEEWQQFEEHFDQVHGQFITRLKKAYPDLTPQELKFSAYLRMNLNTKEMANLLNISVRGVEIGRYRVRKKLGLERQDNLSDFILRF